MRGETLTPRRDEARLINPCGRCDLCGSLVRCSRFVRCALCILCGSSALNPCRVSAQQAAARPEPQAEILASVEVRRDRFQYHFENPSSIDTPFTVPHFFEQRYVADNVWAVLAVRYAAGVRWETSIGATPQRTAPADDHDTFFDPDGTVWVSGTTGGASIRSFRVVQKADIGHAGAVTFAAGFRLRIDLADFQLGHKTVTRNGALVLATDVTSPETASSQLREVFVGATAAMDLGPRWRLSIDGESSPLAVGRLLVRLPEKYPGQDLVFAARAIAGTARVTLARGHVRWPLELSLEAGRTWSYRSTARLSYDQLGARVAFGRAWP